MERFFNKSIVPVLAVLCVIAALASCTRMDDYKDYVKDGEISYTGKIDSLKIYPGHNRVLITGLFISDPKVKSCRIYWNNRRDSVSVPVTRTTGVDTLRTILTGLEEGTQNFEFVTYDDLSNPSVVVRASANVYGDRYQASLINRPIADVELADNGNTTIRWGGLDKTLGRASVVINYTKTDMTGAVVKKLYSDTSSVTVLPDYKYGSKFTYTTEFLPDTTAIDTFYPNDKFAEVSARTNVTSLYITNSGTAPGSGVGSAMVPVSLNEGVTINSTVWRRLAGWTSNAQANNWGSDFDTYGTWVARTAEGVANVGSMSMEAGKNFSTQKLNKIVNGKIYQTKLLPAGEYSLEGRVGNASAGSIYFVVSAGNEIPNIEVLTSRSSTATFTGQANDACYMPVTTIGQGYTITLNFTLPQPTTVSFGIVATLSGTATGTAAGTNQYIKMTYFRMKYLAYN